MKFIKLSEDRYLVEGSNNKIVSKSEIKKLRIIEDFKSNKCAKEIYEGVLDDEPDNVEETTSSNKLNKARRRTQN